MTIVITGSNGFIGKYLTRHLLSLNHKIIELDINFGYDLTKWKSIEKIKNFDILIHFASKSFVPDSFVNPRDFYQTNIMSTLNSLELCRLNNAKMIYTSSYVYGSPEYLPIDEEHPISATNPYAQSKLIGEDLCHAYHRDFGIPIIIFRPFNVYGPRQNDNFLIAKIIKQSLDGRVFLEDSRPKRDFVHVNDVISAYTKGINFDFNRIEIFNIGSGVSNSVREISEIITNKIDPKIFVEFSEIKRKNEVLETKACLKKLKSY